MKHMVVILVSLFQPFALALKRGPWDLDVLLQAPSWEETDKAVKLDHKHYYKKGYSSEQANDFDSGGPVLLDFVCSNSAASSVHSR